MAGQGLRMNGNGRLTAPPQVEVALVTNSVDGIVSEGWNDGPKTLGTTLANWSLGTCSRTRNLRGTLRAVLGGQGLRKFDPVSATQGLSASQGAAARN